MILKGELAIFNQRIIFALYESLNFGFLHFLTHKNVSRCVIFEVEEMHQMNTKTNIFSCFYSVVNEYR